jgi:hypothetical protein
MAQYRTDIKKIDSGQVLTRYEVFGLMETLTPSGSLVDAFGRLRTSNPKTVFMSQNIGAQDGKFDTALTGNGTIQYVQTESSVLMNVTTSNNDSVIRQSKATVPYQPGKSSQILISFVMNEPKSNLVQRVGYFDGDNGIYLENDGETNYFVLRSNTTGTIVETRIQQEHWNTDKFDGAGYSAQTNTDTENKVLDVSKGNILWMDLEWLGVGDVRAGFVVDGIPYVAHIFHNDNRKSAVYMTTGCLHIRQEIKNVGVTTSNSTMRQICSAVMSEGDFDIHGKIEGIGRGFTTAAADTLSTAGTDYPMIAYRLKAGRQNNIVIPNSFHVYVGSNATVSFRVWRNVTVTGGTWETRNAESPVEYNIGITGMDTANGEIIQGGFVTAQSTIQAGSGLDNLDYTLRHFLNNTSETYVLSLIPADNNIKVLTKADWLIII